jgi:hypothetical protein
MRSDLAGTDSCGSSGEEGDSSRGMSGVMVVKLGFKIIEEVGRV